MTPVKLPSASRLLKLSRKKCLCVLTNIYNLLVYGKNTRSQITHRPKWERFVDEASCFSMARLTFIRERDCHSPCNHLAYLEAHWLLWLYKLLRDFEAFTGVLSRNIKSTAGRITKLKALFLAGIGDEGCISSSFKDFCCWRQKVLEKAGCNDLLGNKTMYLLVLHTLHAEGKQISLHLHQKQDYTHAS